LRGKGSSREFRTRILSAIAERAVALENKRNNSRFKEEYGMATNAKMVSIPGSKKVPFRDAKAIGPAPAHERL